MPAHRIHLGYSECTDCSSVKKYVSHTIYPHKTGAWVQPVSEEQSENLSRLDRRGVGSTKRAKGIMSDKSWDRYLEQLKKPKKEKGAQGLAAAQIIKIEIFHFAELLTATIIILSALLDQLRFAGLEFDEISVEIIQN